MTPTNTDLFTELELLDNIGLLEAPATYFCCRRDAGKRSRPDTDVCEKHRQPGPVEPHPDI